MKLTPAERWILANQLTLLSANAPNEFGKEQLERSITIIEEGFELLYDECCQHIMEPMPLDECREALEILKMYDVMQRRHRDLEDTTGINATELRFDGFDGQEVSKYLSFVEFYCEELGRFEGLVKSSDEWDSHSPTLSGYRRMLAVWGPLAKARHFDLTREDIIAILAARRAQ